MRFARLQLAHSDLAERLYPELQALGHEVTAEISAHTDWLILEGATWFHFWQHPEIAWPRSRTITIADQPRIVRYSEISWSPWPCTGWLQQDIPSTWMGLGSDLSRVKTRDFGDRLRPDLDRESLFLELASPDLTRMHQALDQACIPLVKDYPELNPDKWPVWGIQRADQLLAQGETPRSAWGQVSLETWRSPQRFQRSQRQWAERFLRELAR